MRYLKSMRTFNKVVAGRPGAGKQPRVDVLVREFGMVQLSTGSMFREFAGVFDSSGFKDDIGAFYDQARDAFLPDAAIEEALGRVLPDLREARSVVLGLKAKYFMNRGLLVPDSITNEIFSESFAKRGCAGQIIDGYPRTPEQAQHLLDLCRHNGSRLNLVIEVDNEDEIIVERTMGRRICKACGKVYHISCMPSQDGVTCDKCGGHLMQRADDTEQAIRSRLKDYHDKVVPAIEVLRSSGIPLVKVPGNLEPFEAETVRKSVLDAVLPQLLPG